MSRVWFEQELETVATYWRVLRSDGVALGFTTHDADLWFDGMLHRTAPGMIPSAVRCSANLEPDSAEIEGALSHGTISDRDLTLGRYDGARICVGLVDWLSLETYEIFNGTMGAVTQEAGKFNATLESRKAELRIDPIPRTSPSCRARFCGDGCSLSAAQFTFPATVLDADPDGNTVRIDIADADRFVGGELRWLDGLAAGFTTTVLGLAGADFLLSSPLPDGLTTPVRVRLREGCDRTLGTCETRFGNAVNFRGEPHLPGNDLVARYPAPS